MSAPKVLVCGSLCIDLLPSFSAEPQLAPGALLEIGPLRMQPGGCANTACSLADLGTAVSIVADLGDDQLGSVLVSQLQARGVDTTAIRRMKDRATSYSVITEGLEDRCIWHHPGANAEFDALAAHRDDVSVVHLAYPNLLHRLAHDGGIAVERLFAALRSDGVATSLDLAVVDPDAAAAGVDWRAWLERVLPVTDVFAPSIADLRSAGIVNGAATLETAAKEMLRLGAAVVMLKGSLSGMVLATAGRARLDEAGAILSARSDQWADLSLWVPPLDVEVTGTTGAGDAAVAGLLHAIVDGMDASGALRCAAAAAAARVGSGGKIPGMRELQQRLANGWRFQDTPHLEGYTAAVQVAAK